MNIVALSVVIICALASVGVALLTWRAMASVGDELRDLAGFEGIHFED